MRVSFDVDGVLADFVLAFTREAYHIKVNYLTWSAPGTYVDVYSTAEQKEWHFDWPTEFYEEVWANIDQTHNWWMGLEPLVNLEEINAINYLIKNHDVYFITSRKRTLGFPACKQTSLWLESIGINASHAVVIATQAGKKHELINALDIDCHIDDKIEIVAKVANHSQASSFVIDRLYNQNSLFNRFNSVKEYCEWITQHSRELEKISTESVNQFSDLREPIIL